MSPMYSPKICIPSIIALCLASSIAPTAQAVNLVVNGDFDTTTNGVNKQIGTGVGYNPSEFTVASGWYTDNAAPTVIDPSVRPSYNFIFAEGAGVSTGAANRFASSVFFWGAASPAFAGNIATSGNGGTAIFDGKSPTGGNYAAIDGGFDVGAINQQLGGLTVGLNYTLSFSWAVAQQQGYFAPDGLTEKFVVSLGNPNTLGNVQETPTVSYVDKGFQGWFSQSMTFTADSTSPILSFLSVGTPTGQPPFALLDGVSLEVVPEPSSCLIGALTLSGLVLRRRRSMIAG